VKKLTNITSSQGRKVHLTQKKQSKANSTGQILRRNGLLKHVIEGNTKQNIEGTRRQVRRRKQLLDDLKDNRRY
jgi:hypothetical protein